MDPLKSDEMVSEIGTKDVGNCARCKQDHKDLAFLKLGHPITFPGGRTWTHWAACPNNGEPILLEFNPEEGATYDSVGSALEGLTPTLHWHLDRQTFDVALISEDREVKALWSGVEAPEFK